MSVTPAASTDSTSFTETRIHNPRTLSIVRLVWTVLTLLVLAVFALGVSDFLEHSVFGCLCDSIRLVDTDGVNIVLFPVRQGPANGLIFDGDILLAVDGVRLPPGAAPSIAATK